jgi:hypothetical protein
MFIIISLVIHDSCPRHGTSLLSFPSRHQVEQEDRPPLRPSWIMIPISLHSTPPFPLTATTQFLPPLLSNPLLSSSLHSLPPSVETPLGLADWAA